MWENILSSIVMAISEAMCTSWIIKDKRKKINKEINTIIIKNMACFADTTLDCNEFYLLIQSRAFVEMVRNYFCTVKDGMSEEEYIESVEGYIYERCPSVNHIEVRRFIRKIQELYNEYLHKMLEEIPELNLAFQVLTISHRDLMSKIVESENNMKKYFESLTSSKTKIEDKEIEAYHEACRTDYGIIRFTGISGVENKKAQDINKFYVENTFSYYISKEIRNNYRNNLPQIETIQLKEFFNIGNKIVLIGGAGLGKSTTLNYLFCNYEKMYELYPLKIKIDLKEYAKDIGESNKDLLWCIATEFRKKSKRGKRSFEDIENILTEYLDKGKCLVIFDALDEIPSQDVRNKARTLIEVFCEMFYLNRFIISTRETGYLRNQFDDSFLHIKINDFEESQIKQYSRIWYFANNDRKNFKDFWERFCVEVERAKCKGLIRNPIVLILALVIFDIEKSLPNKRVEFYRKCIDTFLTVREDRKGAYNLNENAKNILAMDSAVPKIAFYKYDNTNNNIGYKFSYDELKKAVFVAIGVENEIIWSEAVKQYSKYLVERTELIREVDEDTLDFAHKTFYEYFLSVYYAKEYENEELCDLLKTWIGDANNHELAKLIIEIVIKNDSPKQHNAILSYLFKELHEKEEEKWNNKNDIFMIVVDLYNHNMLHPKFHLLYYQTILFFPRYVERAWHRRRAIATSVLENRVKYDYSLLADMFCQAVQEQKLGTVLESLYYLDEEYVKKITEKTKEEYLSFICELFLIVRNIDTKHKKSDYKVILKRRQEILEYFLNEGLGYTLQNADIFICVVILMFSTSQIEEVHKLFNIKFENVKKFMYFTNPHHFMEIVQKAINDKQILLLLLILMIKCSKHGTNVLFGFLLDYTEEGKQENHITEFAEWLYKTISKTENYNQFKTKLEEREVFVEQWEHLYKEMYTDYQENEKKKGDPRIEEYFDKVKK